MRRRVESGKKRPEQNKFVVVSVVSYMTIIEEHVELESNKKYGDEVSGIWGKQK